MEQAERLHEAGLVDGVVEILEKCFERDGTLCEGFKRRMEFVLQTREVEAVKELNRDVLACLAVLAM